MTVGFICGLAAERRIVEAGTGVSALVACAGADAARAEAEALRLVASGARVLVSFGLAGGLDPALRPGTLLVASEIACAHESLSGDAAWAERMRTAAREEGIPTAAGPVLGSDAPVLSQAHKQELFASTGAIAVDMESHGIARAASRLNAPFVAVRAIADPAGRAVPAFAAAAIRPDGTLDPSRLLQGLVRAPHMLAALPRLAGDARAGYRTLRRVVGLVAMP